jgi:hypothetical protein
MIPDFSCFYQRISLKTGLKGYCGAQILPAQNLGDLAKLENPDGFSTQLPSEVDLSEERSRSKIV